MCQPLLWLASVLAQEHARRMLFAVKMFVHGVSRLVKL